VNEVGPPGQACDRLAAPAHRAGRIEDEVGMFGVSERLTPIRRALAFGLLSAPVDQGL
jgi:hypothetical protein